MFGTIIVPTVQEILIIFNFKLCIGVKVGDVANKKAPNTVPHFKSHKSLTYSKNAEDLSRINYPSKIIIYFQNCTIQVL